MEMAVWVQMSWFDSRLQWHSADFNNITMLVIPGSTVWIPDIVPLNGEQLRKNFATVRDNIPNVKYSNNKYIE